MRLWKRRVARNSVDAGESIAVSVTDTGDASAIDQGVSVTGIRDSRAGTSEAAIRVSQTGDAVASDGGVAITGYVKNLTMVQQNKPREPAEWPHLVGVIPQRAQSFQRRSEVDRLRDALRPGGTTVCQVLSGMGGVGKTQLAADYALTAFESGEFDVVVWVTASNESIAVSGMGQAGVELCRADPGDLHQAARTFLASLQPRAEAKPCRWLVVLDDVADPDDLCDWWPPLSSLGRTLITTRRRDAALTGSDRQLMPVGLFSSDEATTYLSETLASHAHVENLDELAALASDLGCLPLALSQAAAYIVDAGIDVAMYRRLLFDRSRTLDDAAPDCLPDGQTLAVAAAWSLSIDRADQLRPVGLARPLLDLVAMLDPNGIPADSLTSGPALNYLARYRSDVDHAAVTSENVVGALRVLHRLSLIEHTPKIPHQAVRMHELVQRSVRESLTSDSFADAVLAAADSLFSVWPDIENDAGLSQALRANAAALSRCGEEVLLAPGVHNVLFRAGSSLGDAGQVSDALAYYQGMADRARDRLDSDHPDMLCIRNNRARWLAESGDIPGALSEFEQLLADRQRILGPAHLDTLTTLLNFTAWRPDGADPVESIAKNAELVDHLTRMIGPRHHLTLSARNNYAYYLARSGEVADAAVVFERLTADRAESLGPGHPETIGTRHNYAYCLGVMGDAVGAVRVLDDLVADRMRILGPDHPHTLATRSQLAYWRGWSGDVIEAVIATAEILRHMHRVLGPEHPETQTAMINLVHWLELSGVDISEFDSRFGSSDGRREPPTPD